LKDKDMILYIYIFILFYIIYGFFINNCGIVSRQTINRLSFSR